MTAAERKAIIENINANRQKALDSMKEAAKANPHMDPKMRETILNLK